MSSSSSMINSAEYTKLDPRQAPFVSPDYIAGENPDRQWDVIMPKNNLRKTKQLLESDMYQRFPHLVRQYYYEIGQPPCPIVTQENRLLGARPPRESDPFIQLQPEKEEVHMYQKTLTCQLLTFMPHNIGLPISGTLTALYVYPCTATGEPCAGTVLDNAIVPDCEYRFVPPSHKMTRPNASAGISSRGGQLPLCMALHPPPIRVSGQSGSV